MALNLDCSNLPPEIAQELLDLRHQLQLRDQLVSQLSAELFRMVKTHPPALPASGERIPGEKTSSPLSIAPLATHTGEASEVESLRQELRLIEEQIEFYQAQIDKRDLQVQQLQKSCQTLSERNQMLENIVQELPEVYRQKFTDRLDTVKSKVQSLQAENRRLQSQIQSGTSPLPETRSLVQRLSLPSRRGTGNPPPLPEAD